MAGESTTRTRTTRYAEIFPALLVVGMSPRTIFKNKSGRLTARPRRQEQLYMDARYIHHAMHTRNLIVFATPWSTKNS